MLRSILVLLCFLSPSVLFAGVASVIKATAKKTGPGIYRIAVTVRHADDGWDHFANRWEVLDKEGTILAARVLAHPHDDEQPFTRSLSGVRIPDGTEYVIIRAHDSVHEYGGAQFKLTLKK